MSGEAGAKSKALGEESVSKLLWKLSLPSAIGMIVIALYNIADSIFVGQGVGAMALAAVAVVMPAMMFITVFGQALGIGGASVISRALGCGDEETANKVFTDLFSLIIIVGLILVIIGLLFAKPILLLFGSSEEMLTQGCIYFRIILYGSFFMNLLFVTSNAARAEGNARIPMFAMLSSAIINVILDPILIFGFDMGIAGAGWATAFSQFISCMFLLWYFYFGKSHLNLGRLFSKFHIKLLFESISIGFSSFARSAVNSVMSAVLNHNLIRYGGENAVAVFGIIFRLLMLNFMPIFGVNQGFLPIAGYNFGAEKYHRVKEVFIKASIVASAICSFSFIGFMIFSRELIGIFSTDQELIEAGTPALRIVIMVLPIVGFQIIASGYFQALGKALPSFFMAISRQVLFLIPLVIIFSNLWGLKGIYYAFPASDALSAIYVLWMIIPQIRHLDRLEIA